VFKVMDGRMLYQSPGTMVASQYGVAGTPTRRKTPVVVHANEVDEFEAINFIGTDHTVYAYRWRRDRTRYGQKQGGPKRNRRSKR
jgi:hypothetical protein